MDKVKLENTESYIWVHDKKVCSGQVCSVHNRSDHHMRSFPQHWRGDRKIMERTNPFGGSCPDPDEYKLVLDPYEGVHGCIVNPAYPIVGMCGVWYIDDVEAAWINQRYAVTKDGRVWSFIKSMGPKHDNKSAIDYSTPRELQGRPNGKGYLRVTIVNGDERKDHYIHRLVLSAWNGEGPKGFEVSHLDGNPANNQLSNLEWQSKSDNNFKKLEHGSMPLGSGHKNSKLSEESVRAARTLWPTHSLSEIVKILDLSVCNQTLHEAIVGKTWKHVAP